MKKLLIGFALVCACAGHSDASSLIGGISSSNNENITGNWTFENKILAYEKPYLEFVSVSTVVVANNTSTTDQTRIMFKDGDIRTVTEASGSINKFRRFDIARTATFTACGAGFERTGLLSGLTEAASYWYQIYAVKSQCTSGSANFTLVGTTWPHVSTNYGILDTTFASNGWSFLGTIKNGDNVAAPTDIVKFKHSGSLMTFNNAALCNNNNLPGVFLSSVTGGVSTFTYVAGSTGTTVPASITHLYYTSNIAAVAQPIEYLDDALTHRFYAVTGNATNKTVMTVGPLLSEMGLRIQLGTPIAQGFTLSAFVDGGWRNSP